MKTMAAPQAVAAPATLDPAVLRLIEDQTKLIAELSEKVQTLESRTPQYRPMEQHEPIELQERRAQFEREMAGDDRVETLPVTHDGKLISPDMLRHLQPRFEEKQAIRIRPQAHREGWPAGLTWGELLEKRKSNGLGVIMRRYFLSKLGQWKYRVKVKGMTKQDVGDGFYEYELTEA